MGNPANTNCLITMSCAPNLPRENFTALTRLDHNRALAQISERKNIPVDRIHNVTIWGNHSATQYPDISHGFVESQSHQQSDLKGFIGDDKWAESDFVLKVQQRGAAVIAARNNSSAASAAHAIVCHVRDWLLGTKDVGEKKLFFEDF